mmetsp:Transcript_7447/g.13819  ORF Transcript_7447/g.13819 Transcript_7447/m.13819 type:complete len:367 (+) Transcript_7447:128-1228(+)|eukprot:CAMPEP_0201665776 /NCGR_PEP_ID=MMETSP0494-20130426/6817_1 /ASSEMBLY_ACC=CAM_ASM_000839 /TAXON_ID=420259 /ORGANISM="Thalassiosira gravida, Strain GMp14c1" /LENGTH=366 /DNA_ID=CAMNT_0048144801 /DNA_START=98 /DNA_END=1198 /DNA_ORIENTATION=-
MRRSIPSGNSIINLVAISNEKMTNNGTFPTITTTTTSNEYDNSKQFRQGDSSSSQARSPSEIISSIYNDFTLSLARDAILSMICFLFGVYGPKRFILPAMGGLTIRPIPYQMTAAGDVLLDLNLSNDLVPKTDVTFPSEKLWFISLWLPISIIFFLGLIFPLNVQLSNGLQNSPLHNVHAGMCTILVAIGIAELFTQVFKFYVGRLRPNFYAMCGFDKETLECTNGEKMEMEARMSFPSGHTSLSFCGLVCVVLFLLGRGSRISKSTVRGKLLTIVSFMPLLLSFYCATSRLVDNWHHPSDIIAGAIMGTVSACISYHIWFPQLGSIYAGIPLSVISGVEDVSTNKHGSDYHGVEQSPGIPVYSSA